MEIFRHYYRNSVDLYEVPSVIELKQSFNLMYRTPTYEHVDPMSMCGTHGHGTGSSPLHKYLPDDITSLFVPSALPKAVIPVIVF